MSFSLKRKTKRGKKMWFVFFFCKYCQIKYIFIKTHLKKKPQCTVLPDTFFSFLVKHWSVCFAFFKSHFFGFSCCDCFPSTPPFITVKCCSGFPTFFLALFFFPWVGISVLSQTSLLYLSPHFVLCFSAHFWDFGSLPCVCIAQCLYFIGSVLRPHSIDQSSFWLLLPRPSTQLCFLSVKWGDISFPVSQPI